MTLCRVTIRPGHFALGQSTIDALAKNFLLIRSVINRRALLSDSDANSGNRTVQPGSSGRLPHRRLIAATLYLLVTWSCPFPFPRPGVRLILSAILCLLRLRPRLRHFSATAAGFRGDAPPIVEKA